MCEFSLFLLLNTRSAITSLITPTSYGVSNGLWKAVPQSIDKRGHATWIQLEKIVDFHSYMRIHKAVMLYICKLHSPEAYGQKKYESFEWIYYFSEITFMTRKSGSERLCATMSSIILHSFNVVGHVMKEEIEKNNC